MSYQDYARTQAMHQALESRKDYGRRFCDKFGWNLTMNGYDEVQRPDKCTFSGGTLYRTYTQVYHVWYRNKKTGENILIEFQNENSCTVKRNVKVTRSPGCGFNQVVQFIEPSCYSEIIYFSYQSAADYLLRQV